MFLQLYGLLQIELDFTSDRNSLAVGAIWGRGLAIQSTVNLRIS